MVETGSVYCCRLERLERVIMVEVLFNVVDWRDWRGL